jgi:tetratricopeptide (TPR) repeat protein
MNRPQSPSTAALDLWRETARSRGRLVLATNRDLAAFLSVVAGTDPALAARAAAELAVRAWLARRPEPWPENTLPAGLCPEQTMETLRSWLAGRIENPAIPLRCPLPENHDEVAGLPDFPCLFPRHLSRVVSRWQHADGLVPLVVRGAGEPASEPPGALAVPFRLEARRDAHKPAVVAGKDTSEIPGLLPAWEKAWNAALRCGFVHEGRPLRAVFPDLGCAESGLPEGLSAVAPFFLALALRHLARSAPAWTWFASGDIDDRSLGAVLPSPGDAEWRAKALLADALGVAPSLRFLPESWPALSPEKWKPHLRNVFSRFAENIDLDEIESRLGSIDLSMRQGIPEFPAVSAELEEISEQLGLEGSSLSPRRNQLKTRIVLLKGAVACHTGNPDEARRLVESLPGRSGLDGCRLLVRHAVACADQACFPEALAALENAEQSAEHLAPVDRTFVRRDILGTRGQALMARALESGDPSRRAQSLEDLRQALQLTCSIDEDRPAGHSPEESRNLCYILLWHALFTPHSEETGQAYREAADSARCSGDNPAFIHRAAHLAAYRALLSGASAPLSWWPAEDIPLPETLPETSTEWVAATARKYRATLLAAQGETDRALALFREAARLLDNASGLLSFIRATILLQAAESLESLAPHPARQFLADARSTFEEHTQARTLNPESPAAPQHWLAYARQLSENKSGTQSPQLLFQY